MHLPAKVPDNGFYYKHEHDPEGLINNYAYEVVGIGCHTEDDCRPEDANMVVYRPLYEEAPVFIAGKLFYLHPLALWMGTVEKSGKTIPRFTKIDDKDVVAELERIKTRMYGGEEAAPRWSPIMMGL